VPGLPSSPGGADMPRSSEVARIATTLAEAKILNLDVPVAEFLRVPGLDVINPGEKYGWYVVGGDHYVIVCGLDGINQVVNPAERG